MTWLTVTEYLCHICRKHFSVLSSFMTYHRVCNYINTTGATSGARTDHPSGHLSSPPLFSGICVTRSLVLYVVFCRSSFDLFILIIVLSVLRFRNSDYPFGTLVSSNSSYVDRKSEMATTPK